MNNFKWGKRAKEVMNHAMFRYVMYDSFEGGGEFNFFRNIRIILLDNKTVEFLSTLLHVVVSSSLSLFDM